MRPCRADPAKRDDPVAFRQPQMHGSLVVSVHVLIYAVLLHDEDLGTYPQKFIEFVQGQLVEEFLVQYEI